MARGHRRLRHRVQDLSRRQRFRCLHSFAASDTDGQWPLGSLIDVDGVLYGMTSQGGGGGCTDYTGAIIGCGAIFKVNEDGSAFSLLHSFAGREYPRSSLVIVGNVLYGMTPFGGSGGELFKINLDGTAFALVHSFGGGTTEGSEPSGSLIAFNGELFGTTVYGGANNAGTIFKVRTDGGGFTLLHSFSQYSWLGSESDGYGPQGSLVVAGGRLHGMTQAGGVGGLGTVFGIDDDGSGFALLHSFAATANADGAQPTGSLSRAWERTLRNYVRRRRQRRRYGVRRSTRTGLVSRSCTRSALPATARTLSAHSRLPAASSSA